ncbi:MAG: hypothetical protein AB2A00_10060 [Myxococcota bacterium]
MGKKKRHGHFCWVCGRMRANERFSGGGHRRHVCKDCSKLGAEELAYRQHVRNIEQLLHDGVFVRRRVRHVFERYLVHPDPRVRAYAEEIKRRQDEERALSAADHEADAAWEEEDIRFMEEQVDVDPTTHLEGDQQDPWWEEDIPF